MAVSLVERELPVGRREISPLVEFLITGGFTLALFPLSWALRSSVGLRDADLAVGFMTFYAAYVVNDPHFSVTYLLFYKDIRRRALARETPVSARVRYWFAGGMVPLLLIAWAGFALGSHSAPALGWMVQLMFALVGWHYVKQGLGTFLVLSARRGITVSARLRAALLAHCFAGWGFAWANPSSPSAWFEEKGVVYRALAHPRWFEVLTGTFLAVSGVALAIVVATEVRAKRRVAVAPFLGFLVTVWLWTIFSNIDPLVRYVIPALHSVQYFYFVWLLKRNEARVGEANFGRPVSTRLFLLAVSALALGWLLFRGAPTLLDEALVPRARRGVPLGDLGETPFFAAFFVAVNIHHYFMDSVVWRRDNPDTRYLRG